METSQPWRSRVPEAHWPASLTELPDSEMLSPRGQMTICKDNAREVVLCLQVYMNKGKKMRENCYLNQETTLRDPSSADILWKGTSVVYGLTVKLTTLWGKWPFFKCIRTDCWPKWIAEALNLRRKKSLLLIRLRFLSCVHRTIIQGWGCSQVSRVLG